MYNEEKVIIKALQNLLEIDSKGLSIIVIDDGSEDQSHALVNSHFGNHPKIKIYHQQNMGKSSALNRAISLSEKDILICIDADTLVNSDVIDKLLPYFSDKRVAAVSGYVKVGNRVNFLTEMQYAEYLTIQNYDRTVFDAINGVLIVPGALGAFRRSAVMAVGGFKTDALAEDCDITLRMLCSNYVIRNADEAISFTEAPHTVKMFLRQRVRWTVGLIQGLIKHGNGLFRQPNKALAYIVVPFTWLYRIILPLLIPLVDYFSLYAVFFPGRYELMTAYCLFIFSDALIIYFILSKKKERVDFITLFFLHRIYRHLTLAIYVSIFLKWLRGNLYGWSKIPRQGNVKVD